eukprot:7056906-Heterocapsa_arctica.AAC.1
MQTSDSHSSEQGGARAALESFPAGNTIGRAISVSAAVRTHACGATHRCNASYEGPSHETNKAKSTGSLTCEYHCARAGRRLKRPAGSGTSRSGEQ